MVIQHRRPSLWGAAGVNLKTPFPDVSDKLLAIIFAS